MRQPNDGISAAWLDSFAKFTQPVVQPAVQPVGQLVVKCTHRVTILHWLRWLGWLGSRVVSEKIKKVNETTTFLLVTLPNIHRF